MTRTSTGRRLARPSGATAAVLFLCVVAAPPAGLAVGGPAASGQASARLDPETAAFLDKVDARLKAYASYRDWTATSVSKVTETDRKGNPERVTVVNKIVRVANGRRADEILKAVETTDGREKDITQDLLREQREREERWKRRQAEERARAGSGSGGAADRGGQGGQARGQGSGGGGGRGYRFDIDEIVPFPEKVRPAFDFSLRRESGADGRALAVLEVKARKPDSRLFEGTYVIDAATFDVLRADLRPSKNPRFVKELEVSAEVEIVDGKYLVLKRSRYRVNAGFLIKHVRRIVEDEYSDVRIAGPPAPSH